MNQTYSRSFMEHAPAATAMFDRNMRYILASRRWVNDFGLQGPLSGRSLYDGFPSASTSWRDLHARALSGEILGRQQSRFDYDDGSSRWMQWEAYLWREDDGRAGGLIISAYDITAWKSAEEHHSIFMSLAENNHEFVGIYDSEAAAFLVNSAGRRMVGLSTGDAISIEDLFFPEDRDFIFGEFLPRVLREGHGDIEIRFRNIGGGAVWAHCCAFTLVDAAGKLLGYAVTGRDIADGGERRDSLIGAERRLQAVMRAAPIGIAFSHDASCERISGNPTLLKQFETSADSNILASAPDLAAPGEKIGFFRNGRELIDLELPLQQAVRQGREIAPMDIEVLLPSGRRWIMAASAAPIFGDEGETLGGVAVTMDVTERKRLEEAQRRNELRLERDLESMTRLQKLGALFVRDGDVEPILKEIVDVAIAICEADFGAIKLVDRATGALRIVAQRGFPEWWVAYWNAPPNAGACTAAFERGERVIVEDVEESALFAGSGGLEAQRSAGVRSVQSTPLIARSGKLLGVFSTHKRTPGRPGERELRLLDLLARQAADIVERVRAEEKLRRSREDFVRAQEVGQIGWWRQDTRRNILTWSDETYRIFGVPKGTPLSYETFLQTVHPNDRDFVEARWKAALKGEAYDIEHRIIVDGHEKWVREKAYLEFEEGVLCGGFGISQDVTERKRAEEALRESELRERLMADELRTILNTAPIGLAIAPDREGRRLTGNQAFQKIFGASSESGLSPTCANPEFLSFEDGRELKVDELPIGRALRGESVDDEVFAVRREDGKTLVVLAKAAPLLDQAGASRGALGAFLDITALKQAEAEAKESEARFRTLAEMSPDAILVDQECCYVYANPAAVRLLGAQSVTDVIGRTPFDITPPEYHERIRECVRRILENSEAGGSREARWRRFDGTLVDVEVLTGPIIWRGRQAIQVVTRDITERKRAEEALREADRRKDEFLAMLAHELRNPLAPIRNGLHVLERLGGVRDARLLPMMARQVDHLIRLVDDLLEISRVSRGAIELKKERADLAEILRHALDTSRPLIEAGGHQVMIDVCSSRLTLDADPVRLSQVFTNLLNNAAKYTEKGGRIWVKAERVDPHAIVSVRDEGIGISAEMLPRVFDLFVQAGRPSGKPPSGIGVGLTLARSLVEMHGGEVEARSAGLGCGAEFLVRLPLASAAGRESSEEKPTSSSLPAPRRALADDDNETPPENA